MKDFLLRDLIIGDYVIFPGPYQQGMKLGKITKFTPQNIRVEFPTHNGVMTNTLRPPGQCVRVEGPDLTWFLLSKNNTK